MSSPIARPPIGPRLIESLPNSEPVSNRTGNTRIAGFLEEVRDFAAHVEVERLAWQVARWIPPFTFTRTRARLLSLLGCDIAPGTAVAGYVHIIGERGSLRRLRIGRGCILGPDVTFCLDAPITLGRNVSIGPRAVLYTATHPLGVASRRMELDILARPIVVDDGAWVGLGAMILPGVRVGRGSVVAAGAVVNEDVPTNVLVAGNPSRVVQELPDR